jgi:HEAT repeat protein
LVRLAAAQVLSKWEDPALAPHLLELLTDRHFEVRMTAVLYARRISDPNVAVSLLPLLADTDSDVRLATAQSLGAFGNPVAIEALVVALTDEERAVRETAERALEQIDPNWIFSEYAHRAADRLTACLSDPRGWVRSAATQVVARLRAAGTGAPSA